MSRRSRRWKRSGRALRRTNPDNHEAHEDHERPEALTASSRRSWLLIVRSPVCGDPKRTTVCSNRDLPISIRAQHCGSNRLETPQHLRRRVAEAIAAAAADHRDLWPPAFEERRRGGRAAAVMRDLEDSNPRPSELRQDRALDLGADVSGE